MSLLVRAPPPSGVPCPRPTLATVTVFASPASWIESDAARAVPPGGRPRRHASTSPRCRTCTPARARPSARPWRRPCCTRSWWAPTSAAASPCSRSGSSAPYRSGSPPGSPTSTARWTRSGTPTTRPGPSSTATSRPVTSRPRDGRPGQPLRRAGPRRAPSSTPGHASRLGLDAGDLVLIVHSGSRGLGERILRAHTEVHGAGAAPDPAAYLARTTTPCAGVRSTAGCWPPGSRTRWGPSPPTPIVDQCHNLVEVRDGVYLHRKGAAPGDGRDVLVAGTRGTPSYLVAAHAGPEANHSVAHGAGRKMSRADALRRGRAKHTVEELRRTPVGSLVVCGDRQLLFEEAPTAYKRIEQVIADLVEHGWPRRWSRTSPLVTYKTPDLGSTARPTGGATAAGEAGREHAPAAVGRARSAGVRLGAGPAAAPPATPTAARRGLTIQQVQAVPGDRAGTYRSVLIRISGADAEAFAASWTGTLCWQAPSPYRTSAGRKNWYVTAQPCQPRRRADDVRGGGRRHRRLPHRRARRSAPQQGQHGGTGDAPSLGHRRRGGRGAAVQPQPPDRPAAAAATHRAGRRDGAACRHHRPVAHPRRTGTRRPRAGGTSGAAAAGPPRLTSRVRPPAPRPRMPAGPPAAGCARHRRRWSGARSARRTACRRRGVPGAARRWHRPPGRCWAR